MTAKILLNRVVFPILSAGSVGCLAHVAYCDARTSASHIFGVQKDVCPVKAYLHQYPANDPIEDRLVSRDFTGRKGHWAFLMGVFDGHGGWQLSDFISKSIFSALEQTTTDEDIKHVFTSIDRSIADSLRSMSAMGFSRVGRVGSCATVVGVDKKWTKVTAMNLGDSRAIVIRSSGEVVELTAIHNANEASEQAKLRALHPNEDDIVRCHNKWTEKVAVPAKDKSGNASNLNSKNVAYEIVTKYSGCYVKGRLQPTRSFGDFHLKYPEFNIDMDSKIEGKGYHSDNQVHLSYPYISSEPDVTHYDIRSDDLAILIGSDGVWDYLSNEEISKIFLSAVKSGSLDDATKALTAAVLQKAAKESSITYEAILALAPGKRRNVHDDISIGIAWLDPSRYSANQSVHSQEL